MYAIRQEIVRQIQELNAGKRSIDREFTERHGDLLIDA